MWKKSLLHNLALGDIYSVTSFLKLDFLSLLLSNSTKQMTLDAPKTSSSRSKGRN